MLIALSMSDNNERSSPGVEYLMRYDPKKSFTKTVKGVKDKNGLIYVDKKYIGKKVLIVILN
jgi:putative transposon-encoded protein